MRNSSICYIFIYNYRALHARVTRKKPLHTAMCRGSYYGCCFSFQEHSDVAIVKFVREEQHSYVPILSVRKVGKIKQNKAHRRGRTTA